MKYKVLKPFFYLPEQKNYLVDETIELTKEKAENMLNHKYIEEVKETKKAKAND